MPDHPMGNTLYYLKGTEAPGKTQYPFYRRLDGPPGPVWAGGKSHPHRDSIPDRPARSQLLYRLSYRARTECMILNLIMVSVKQAHYYYYYYYYYYYWAFLLLRQRVNKTLLK